MNKRCGYCGEVKPLSDFNRRTRSVDGRQYHCKQCMTSHLRTYRIARHGQLWARIAEIKLARGCDECGYADDAKLLDWHHPNDDKVTDVSRLISCDAAWKRIEAEIAKCVLLCKSCHARIHNGERREAS